MSCEENEAATGAVDGRNVSRPREGTDCRGDGVSICINEGNPIPGVVARRG